MGLRRIIPLIFLTVLFYLVRKGWGNVSPLSTLFAIDDIYGAPTATLILTSVFEGSLDKEFMCQLVTEKWLTKKNSGGKLAYPELCQSMENWLGYVFWKSDDSFNVSNHVRVITTGDEVKLTSEQFRDFMVQLVNAPFVRRKSPWEIILLHHSQESSSTLVLLRIHHSLMDGVSIMNLSRNLTDYDENSGLDKKAYLCERVSKTRMLKGLLRIPYFAAKFLMDCPISNFRKPSGSKKVVRFAHHSLDIAMMKKLKTRCEVSLTSLLLAGFTAAVRHALSKTDGLTTVPQNYKCAVPVPLPGHSEKLRNYMSFVCVNLPIHISSSWARLQSLHRDLEDARNSLDVFSLFYLLKCVGTLPCFLAQALSCRVPVTFLLSNFPGLSIQCNLEGRGCRQLLFNGGLLQGNTHAVCSSVGYNGAIGLAVTADEFLGIKAEKFMEAMLQEFEILENLSQINTEYGR